MTEAIIDPGTWLGINYWPPRKAMYWWKQFDLAEVDEEFANIASWGFGLVRFCLLWEDFQPTPTKVDTHQLENMCRVMDKAHERGLQAVPTLLVGNMSGIMWFPHWAFTEEPQEGRALQISEGSYNCRRVRSPFDDPGMLESEALLARDAAAAIAGHPALHSWDLANEIDQACLPQSPNSALLWSQRLASEIRTADPSARLTYGAHSLSLTTHGLTIPALTPSLDYLCMHGYPLYSDIARAPLDSELVPFVTLLTAQLGERPTMMQEFGVCTAPPGEPSHSIEDDFLGEKKPQFLASEADAAEYYGRVLDRLWEIGALAAVAWNYADYVADLWDKPPLDRAKRERTFGIFRADGSPKPAAEILRSFSSELQSQGVSQRLGPFGAKAFQLSVESGDYYRDPDHSYRMAYAEYLGKIQGPH